MDKIRIQEYTLFGLGEVQRWSEIPPYRESNAADERDKLVAKLLDEIEKKRRIIPGENVVLSSTYKKRMRQRP